MATLYISEYQDVANTGYIGIQVPLEPPLAEQTITISGSSTQCTNAFNEKTKFVRLQTDTPCSVLFGTNPTATTSKGRLPFDCVEFRGVPVGLGYKVAVISN